VSSDAKTTEWIKLNEANVEFTLTIIYFVYFFLIKNCLLFIDLYIISISDLPTENLATFITKFIILRIMFNRFSETFQ